MVEKHGEEPRQRPENTDDDEGSPGTESYEASEHHPAAESKETEALDGASAVFPLSPLVEGEFTVPLDQLVIGADHPRRRYDFENGVGKALFHAALDPAALTPILVLLFENIWYVIDGWARVLALRLQHEDNPAVLVRGVRWTGTAETAVYQRFSQSFLTLASAPIERAREALRMSEVWVVPDLVIAARIGWTPSKLSKHLTAARGERDEPRFADLLQQPAKPPMDYLYKVGRALADAGKDDAAHPRRSAAKGAVTTLRKRLEALLARNERFEPRHALVVLGIVPPTPEPELPFGAAAGMASGPEPLNLEDVVGHDDVVIGALERHSDGGRRLLLPDEAAVSAMTPVEKAAAKAAYHDAVDRLFG
ncbi:hypothetical protein [Sphingomonas bacterium]|uniref:hypothetical protein n=1 Tax=Sphingomonas bacterium TaxID=1895847 RepID=UPI0015774AF0|nr:hypothetical protein [Sphingomonas bacterium]